MSKEFITLKVDDRRLRERYKKLEARGDNMYPAFEEIGEVAISSIERNFQVGGRHSGDPGSALGGAQKFQPLSPITIAARAKRGHWPGKILQETGQLAASISAKPGPKSVEVGPNKEYDAIQHFGGKAGRGRKVTIPARPYVVVQNEDIDEAVEILERHLTRGV